MRPIRVRLAPALAAATLVPWSTVPVSGQAPPVATLTYTTPATPTAVAGQAGEEASTLSVQGSSGLLGIRELAWADTDAGLCRLAVAAAGASPDRWDACDGGATPRGFRVEEGHLVGLRVCTDPRDGAGGPLRGVAAIWALRPDRPDAGRGETTREAAGDRCRRWTDEVRCPAGTAGPRLRLHRPGDDGRAAPVGLQLLCHRVELQCWDVGPDEVVTAAPATGCRRPAAVGEGPSPGR